jgi:hypothetical protein
VQPQDDGEARLAGQKIYWTMSSLIALLASRT